MTSLPHRVLAWYGDDFTGSTDALEALSANGVPGVLFFDAPSAEQLARFAEYRAVGVAGVSRSESPEWMSANLPRVFDALRGCAPVVHYKTCSTFDSSPPVGSIGRAIEIFGAEKTPLIVGAAPWLKRYVVFGNLFAAYAGATYRIDRHPVMSRHPVTPMDEGDLRVHLARQTSKTIGLVDLAAIQAGRAMEEFDARAEDIVLFDGVDEASLAEAGRVVWERRCPFVAGSSGVEYALIAHWRRAGLLGPAPAPRDAGCVERMVVVSGSCSPTTERQIRHALAHGYAGVAIDPANWTEEPLDEALAALSEGRSVVIYTALGPGGEMFRDSARGDAEIGRRLGRMLDAIVRQAGVRRAVVCGGDTSGYAARELGIEALTMTAPVQPGSPLCRAWSADGAIDGLEIALKGGQVGDERYFEIAVSGQPSAVSLTVGG